MTHSTSAPRRGGMVRNIFHLGLGQVATTILTILLTATLARVLAPSDFGLLYLITSITTFAYVIVDWGHGPLIIRETARNPERSGDLLGSALVVRSAFALLACAVAVAATWLLGYDTHTCLLTGALILGSLPQYLGLSFCWVFRGLERMDLDALLPVVLKVVTLAGAIACFALGGRLLGLIVAWTMAGCLTLGMGMALHRKLDLPRITAKMSTVRELLREGAPLLAMSLAIAVEPLLNANVLFKMSSTEVVGWFGAASNFVGTLIAPGMILGMAMFPRLSRAAGDAAGFKWTFDTSFRPLLLLAVLGAVGIYLFADVPVAIIYGLEKFGPTVDILRAFGPVVMLLYVDVFLGSAMVAAGKAGRLAGIKVVSVALTTGLLFVLVPLCEARLSNGGLGVAYAMIIGELLMVAAACILIREVVDRRTIGNMCRNLIAGAATVLLFRLLPPFTPFLAIPMCVLVFGILAFLVGAVKRSDIEVLQAAFRKSTPAPAAGADDSPRDQER